MKKIEIKNLDPKRFNALAGLSRSPAAAYISEELAWYSNEDESIIGVLLRDITDDDYVGIVMARDEVGIYRCFDSESSIPSQTEAEDWLIRAMKWHSCQPPKICAERKTVNSNLFDPVIPLEKQHPYFVHLTKHPAFIPARRIITEMMPYFVDIDGNFVEQFQSKGFDARLWELYIYASLAEEGLFIDREHASPDFIVRKYGKTVAIEAVIVGRKDDNPPIYYGPPPQPPDPDQIREAHRNEMPIKFGSPLYSKLQKEYWKLGHVKGNPLVFAIADFHDNQSMLWSSTALSTYLYGVTYDFYYDDRNQLVMVPIEIPIHKLGRKEIPSGFFFQPNTEHISAVLFSASGTISKFNRIGRQAGFGDLTIFMIRMGTCHDHDPNATVPRFFRYRVSEESEETWADGISMFHNPNAIHPVPEDLFPSIAHHKFIDGQIVSMLPEFYVYASMTYNFIPERK